MVTRVIVVTGAGSGIGRAIAAAVAEPDTLVAVCDIDFLKAQETVNQIGQRCFAIEMDVARSESVVRGVREIVDNSGGIDVLVNNAGISIPGTVEALPEEMWDRGFAVNAKSVYLVSKAAWPALRERRGAIVNIASISGIWPGPDDAAYCASKAAVIMLTRCMALDGAMSGIRVTCVCPGWVATPMVERLLGRRSDPSKAREAVEGLHPLGRLGRPADIAGAVRYLISDDASWVTGTALAVDGGLTAGLSPEWMPE